MTLDFYMASRYLRMVLIVFAIFTALVFLSESLEQIRLYSSHNAGAANLLLLTTLRAPFAIYQILPMIVVIASLSYYLSLARTSELVVARAAGRSALRHMIGPLVVCGCVGIFAVALLNPLAAAMQKTYEARTVSITSGSDRQVYSISSEGLWLREGSEEGQSVIRAAHTNFDASLLEDVTIYSFTADGAPSGRVEAKTAQIEDGAWVLGDAKQWAFTSSNNPEADAQYFDRLSLPTTLDLSDIRSSFSKSQTIGIWKIPARIESLAAAGFSTRHLQMQLQSQLALPFVLISMLMIAAVFSMRHTRLGGTSFAVFLAVLISFSFFFLLGFSEVLGQNGKLPLAMAAWVPPIAMIMAALALLLHFEDG